MKQFIFSLIPDYIFLSFAAWRYMVLILKKCELRWIISCNGPRRWSIPFRSKKMKVVFVLSLWQSKLHIVLAVSLKREKTRTEPMIDGHVVFLFLDKNDMPMVALHWEKYMQHSIQKYNKIYKIQMPKVTPHVCRHTFCSNMAKSGMNPKTLQYIMGHSDVSVTLNTYTHVNLDDAEKELRRVAES